MVDYYTSYYAKVYWKDLFFFQLFSFFAGAISTNSSNAKLLVLVPL
jgi:hypothetical protein